MAELDQSERGPNGKILLLWVLKKEERKQKRKLNSSYRYLLRSCRK